MSIIWMASTLACTILKISFSLGACINILFCCDQLQIFPFGLELFTFVSNSYLRVVIYLVWRLVVLHYEDLSNRIEDPRFADLFSNHQVYIIYIYIIYYLSLLQSLHFWYSSNGMVTPDLQGCIAKSNHCPFESFSSIRLEASESFWLYFCYLVLLSFCYNSFLFILSSSQFILVHWRLSLFESFCIFRGVVELLILGWVGWDGMDGHHRSSVC